MKKCSTWAEVLQRLEKTFPVYETHLSVRTQIEELLPEFASAARISEYMCDLDHLFSRMNVGSYGNFPHKPELGFSGSGSCVVVLSLCPHSLSFFLCRLKRKNLFVLVFAVTLK